MAPLAKNAGRAAAVLFLAASLAVACGGDDQAQQQAAQSQAAQAQAAQQQETPPRQQQAAQQEQPAAQPAQQEQSDSAGDSAPQQTASDEQQETPAQQEQQARPAPSDDGSAITLADGQPLAARITDQNGVQVFRFAAAEGDWIRVSVDGKNGMDPVAVLAQADGTEIASNDDVSRLNRDSLIVAQSPVSGTLQITVSGYDGETGSFEITAAKHEPTADGEDALVSIVNDIELRGVLDTPEDADIFEFDGRAGRSLLIYVDGAIGADVYLQLFDGDRSIVATDDDGGHGLDAEISYTLPADGRYVIEVWPAVNGTGQRPQIGPYRLFIRENLGLVPVAAEDADAVAAAGLSFLEALRTSDSATIFSLAGPEALAAWGWESKLDVDADLDKIAGLPLQGDDLQTAAFRGPVDPDRARFYVQFAEDDWFRVELVNDGGQWAVDAWTHAPSPFDDGEADGDDAEAGE